jgi:hypothetical protein
MGLAVILAGLSLVTLWLTFYFVSNAPGTIDSTEEIRIEIIKSLLEILAVTLTGAVVAALFKAYERNQEQLQVRTQIRLDFINKISRHYRTIKKIRRALRWHGIRMGRDDTKLILNKEQIDFYAKQMGDLNDVQLEIEGFKIRAENSFLFENSEPFGEHLWRMENYLNQIVKEFESYHHKLQQNGEGDLANFPYLREFTSGASNNLIKESVEYNLKTTNEDSLSYCFKKEFSLSYRKILEKITDSKMV